MKFYNHKDIKQKYCMMSKLASSLLCLPFSNSEIERMFSQFKLTKTQLRISLNDDTIGNGKINFRSRVVSRIFGFGNLKFLLIKRRFYE